MQTTFKLSIFIFFLLGSIITANAQETDTTKIPVPIFEDGEAQIVPEFNTPDQWIKEELWVETTFDSGGIGQARQFLQQDRPVYGLWSRIPGANTWRVFLYQLTQCQPGDDLSF